MVKLCGLIYLLLLDLAIINGCSGETPKNGDIHIHVVEKNSHSRNGGGMQMLDDEEVGMYELKTDYMYANFTNWGAALTSLYLPDKHGQMADVILGYNSIDDYKVGEAFNLLESLGGPVSAPVPPAATSAGVGTSGALIPSPTLSPQPVLEHFSRDHTCYTQMREKSGKEAAKSSSRSKGEKRKSGGSSKHDSRSRKRHRKEKATTEIVTIDPDSPRPGATAIIPSAIPTGPLPGGSSPGRFDEATIEEFFASPGQSQAFVDAVGPIPRAVRALFDEAPSRGQFFTLLGQMVQMAVVGSQPQAAQRELLAKEVDDLRQGLQGRDVRISKLEADNNRLVEEQRMLEAKLHTITDQLKSRDQEISIVRSRAEVAESSLSSKEKEYASLKVSFDHVERELKDSDADWNEKLLAEAARSVQEFVGSRRFTQRMDYYSGYRYGLLDLMYRTQLKLKGVEDFSLNYRDPLGYPTDPPPFHPSEVGSFPNDGDCPLEAWQPVALERSVKIVPGCEGMMHDPLETLRNGFAKVALLQTKKEEADSNVGDV